MATEEYDRVLSNYEMLLKTLRSTDRAVSSLRAKFISNKWIPYGSTANEEALMTKALNQIENNGADYDVFVGMLRELDGLQSVVDKITGVSANLPIAEERKKTPPCSPDSSSSSPEYTSTDSEDDEEVKSKPVPAKPSLDVVSETEDTGSTGEDSDAVKCKPSSSSPELFTSVEQVKGSITIFHEKFNSMKLSTIEILENCQISVAKVVYYLTSILALVEHKRYLEEKQGYLDESKHHWELFGKLNFYWNYLSFSLFAGLVKELAARNSKFKKIKKKVDQYEIDLSTFRKSTPLLLFCQIEPDLSYINLSGEIPPEFRKMVTTHNWPDTVTLEDAEQFRKSFLKLFNSPDCAMAIHRIRRNCFIITWFLICPDNIVSLVKQYQGSIKPFKDFKVESAVIDEEMVYEKPPLSPEQTSPPLPISPVTEKSTPFEQGESHSIATFEMLSSAQPMKEEAAVPERGDRPTLSLLKSFPLRCPPLGKYSTYHDGRINIIEEIAHAVPYELRSPRYLYRLAYSLLKDGSTTNKIIHQYRDDETAMVTAIFETWLEEGGRDGPPTWDNLVIALYMASPPYLAIDIRRHLT